MGSVGQSEEPGDVIISCKDHSKLLVDGFQQLLREDYLVDANVIFKGSCFKVHRLILAVFLPKLKSHMNNAHANGIAGASQVLSMDYVASEADDVKVLLEFLYCGRVAVQKERIQQIGQLAKDLNVESLAKAIDELESDAESSQASPDSAIEQEQIREKASINGNESSSSQLEMTLRSKSNQCIVGKEDMYDSSSSKSQETDEKNAVADSAVIESTVEYDDDDDDDDDDNNIEVTSEGEQDDSSDDSDWSPEVPVKRKMTRSATDASSTDEKQSNEPFVHMLKDAQYDEQREFQSEHRPQIQSELSSDVSTSTDVLPTCEMCKKKFLTQRSLLFHQTKGCTGCSEEKEFHPCTLCSRNLSSHRSLLRHVREVHEKRGHLQVPIKCPQCDFTCNMKYKLRAHNIRMHTAERAHKCPECLYSAMYRGEIERHVRLAHRKERKFMCEMCGSCYSMSISLKRHIMEKHQGIKAYKCEHCGKGYRGKKSLTIHVQTKHTMDVQRHFCDICGKNYIARWGLQYHLRHAHGTTLEPLKKPYGPRNPCLEQEPHENVTTETEMPNLETANFEIGEQHVVAIEDVNAVLV